MKEEGPSALIRKKQAAQTVLDPEPQVGRSLNSCDYSAFKHHVLLL
jgi:hypothetical protein